MQTRVLTFPSTIADAIAGILAAQENDEWIQKAMQLHQRYMSRTTGGARGYVRDFTDTLSYLALRTPATYAQTYGAMSAVAELLPSWQPKRILDLGSGPGVGVWAAKSIWPSLEDALCVEQETSFVQLGEQIMQTAERGIRVRWEKKNLLEINSFEAGAQKPLYDLVVISNVLNELSAAAVDKVLGRAWNVCCGVLLLVEPGTPLGSGIIASAAKKLSHTGTLLAPYIAENWVDTSDYYLHFPQRFIRPEFLRRVRQRMREDALMASDWEEAKYSYVAIGRMKPEKVVQGRCVGSVKAQKGFVEVPLLRAEGITVLKVLKREKEVYNRAKKLHWGDVVDNF
jgi:ribosomal protein RSM22 (predicted rRNA methylase)